MTKRYFKLELNGRGGEFIQGEVTPEFVEYWEGRDSDDLVEHLTGVTWDDEDMLDSDSPDMTADGDTEVWECDDFEHFNACYSDNGYFVQEVALKSADAWDEEFEYVEDPYENELDVGEGVFYEDFEHWVGGREAYTSGTSTDSVPVIQYFEEAKGNFGVAYVVTDGEDFNPENIAISVIETDLGEFLGNIYYGKKLLTLNYDYADTTGKSTTAEVGYVDESHIVDLDDFEEEVQETLAETFDAEPA